MSEKEKPALIMEHKINRWENLIQNKYLFEQRLQNLLMNGIQTGAVRPLTLCTFEKNQIEQAYRYMAAGKHVGKVNYCYKLWNTIHWSQIRQSLYY